jgi:hypothetical protein
MPDLPADKANPYAHCEPGTEQGQYVPGDGLPRVWDGAKWLSPKDALEAGVIDLTDIGQPVTDEELGHLKAYSDGHHLQRIPGWYVLDLSDWRYSSDGDGPKCFGTLGEAREAFWEAIHEAIQSRELDPSDVGRLVHSRSVYSEDGCGENWETASVYDCPGLAVIDYGSFPCTCDVPRFEIHDTVEEAKDTLESFVEELECNAQGNIDYKWRAKVWNEGEKEIEYGASWQDEEEDEEDEEEDEEQPEEEDADDVEDCQDGEDNPEDDDAQPPATA